MINNNNYIHECFECGYSFKTSHSIGLHLLKKHNMSLNDYNIKYNRVPDTFCIFCKTQNSYDTKTFNPRIKKCCTQEFKIYMNPNFRNDARKTAKTNNQLKRDKGINNYSIAAKERERKLRNTIESNGYSRKHNIVNNPIYTQKLSKIMKDKIANGEFTPNITNSWANSKTRLEVDNCNYLFRSSWEAIFWSVNQHLQYEKTRIPYIFNNSRHTYIVDFTDPINQILYEIKPKSEKTTKKNICKFAAMELWCIENNYTYKIITENWFYSHIPDFECIQVNTKLSKSIDNFKKQAYKNRHTIVDDISAEYQRRREEKHIK